MVSYFEDVPLEMEEAALLDRAGRLRALWYVILPQVRGGIAVTTIFVFLNAWNEFMFAVVLGGNRVRTVTVAMFNFISVEQTQWAKLAAGGDARDAARDPDRLRRAAAHRQGTDGRRRQGRRPAMTRHRAAFASKASSSGTATTTVLHGVDLAIEPGEFFVLLGPSGSGKTTTLRILAGLESVSAGTRADGRRGRHDAGARRARRRDGVPELRAVSAHDRGAEHRLSAEDGRHRRRGTIARAVADAAAKVGIGHLLDRTPGQLSGGQQQRCALARAIVRKPRLFLLDEPLSNLDAKLRLETRLELHALQRTLGATTVYVTHDQEEAMTLADRIAVFMDGRIVQVGTPREVFARPQTVDVAAFIGTPPMNLMPGVWEGDAVTVDGHALPLMSAAPSARQVTLGVRPGDLRIADAGLPARVERVEDLGDSSIVSFVAGERLLKLKSDRLPLVAGRRSRCTLRFAPGAAHLFDRQTGTRL